MNRRMLAIGYIALILVGSVLACGCARERGGDGAAPRPPALRATPPPQVPGTTTGVPAAGSPSRGAPSPQDAPGSLRDPGSCAAKGGSICTVGTECPGTWIEASDTFSCCSKPCTGAAGSPIVTIDPYETEVTNSDMGDIL